MGWIEEKKKKEYIRLHTGGDNHHHRRNSRKKERWKGLKQIEMKRKNYRVSFFLVQATQRSNEVDIMVHAKLNGTCNIWRREPKNRKKTK